MIFPSSKLFMISAIAAGGLLLALIVMGKLYANAQQEIGYYSSENDRTQDALNRSNTTVMRLKEELAKSERVAKATAQQLVESQARISAFNAESTELEAEDESYKEYRDSAIHPVTARRLREAQHCSANRIRGMQSPDELDPVCNSP